MQRPKIVAAIIIVISADSSSSSASSGEGSIAVSFVISGCWSALTSVIEMSGIIAKTSDTYATDNFASI